MLITQFGCHVLGDRVVTLQVSCSSWNAPCLRRYICILADDGRIVPSVFSVLEATYLALSVHNVNSCCITHPCNAG